MSTSMTLSNDLILRVEETPQGVALVSVLGGARLELRVQVFTNKQPHPALGGVRLSGTVLIGNAVIARQHELCAVSSDYTFTPQVSPQTVTLQGYVSARALLELEEVRLGGPLTMALEGPTAVWVDGNPPGASMMQTRGTALTFQLYGEQWLSQLENVTAASYVEVMVPITGNPELQTAAGRIRTARRYIGEGNLDAVAGELRQALEPVREAYNVLSLYQTALAKTGTSKKDRTKDERWALAVQSLYDYLSAFVHDDSEAIKGCTMDRAEANDALADVAGKLHRLATDRRAGLR